MRHRRRLNSSKINPLLTFFNGGGSNLLEVMRSAASTIPASTSSFLWVISSSCFILFSGVAYAVKGGREGDRGRRGEGGMVICLHERV